MTLFMNFRPGREFQEFSSQSLNLALVRLPDGTLHVANIGDTDVPTTGLDPDSKRQALEAYFHSHSITLESEAEHTRHGIKPPWIERRSRGWPPKGIRLPKK